MPTHNSPRWRAANEGRPDLLAWEIGRRRTARGYSWEVGYEERRWLDDLTESLRERFDEYLGDGPRVSIFDPATLAGWERDLQELLETPRSAPSDVEWSDPPPARERITYRLRGPDTRGLDLRIPAEGNEEGPC